MDIKSKYEIGQKVWVVYEHGGEVSVYDDYIDEICVNSNGIYYILKEEYVDQKEENIVLYEDTNKLVEKIKTTMEEIKNKESK